nr:sigma factor-like helix-turn-helix DNA-binding protein [Pseudonocardia acidicola]
MLLAAFRQQAAELARLRRVAIEEAHDQGMTYTEIATALGITKGRITQIRNGVLPSQS